MKQVIAISCGKIMRKFQKMQITWCPIYVGGKKHFSTYEFSSVQCHFTWIYYWQHNIRHKTWEKFPLENNLPKMAILILKIFQSFLGKCRKFKNIFFKCVFFYICTFYHLVAHLLTDIQFVKINIRENINIYDGNALKQ